MLNTMMELYDLEANSGETKNLAKVNPEEVDRILKIMNSARTESEMIILGNGADL